MRIALLFAALLLLAVPVLADDPQVAQSKTVKELEDEGIILYSETPVIEDATATQDRNGVNLIVKIRYDGSDPVGVESSYEEQISLPVRKLTAGTAGSLTEYTIRYETKELLFDSGTATFEITAKLKDKTVGKKKVTVKLKYPDEPPYEEDSSVQVLDAFVLKKASQQDTFFIASVTQMPTPSDSLFKQIAYFNGVPLFFYEYQPSTRSGKIIPKNPPKGGADAEGLQQIFQKLANPRNIRVTTSSTHANRWSAIFTFQIDPQYAKALPEFARRLKIRSITKAEKASIPRPFRFVTSGTATSTPEDCTTAAKDENLAKESGSRFVPADKTAIANGEETCIILYRNENYISEATLDVAGTPYIFTLSDSKANSYLGHGSPKALTERSAVINLQEPSTTYSDEFQVNNKKSIPGSPLEITLLNAYEQNTLNPSTDYFRKDIAIIKIKHTGKASPNIPYNPSVSTKKDLCDLVYGRAGQKLGGVLTDGGNVFYGTPIGPAGEERFIDFFVAKDQTSSDTPVEFESYQGTASAKDFSAKYYLYLIGASKLAPDKYGAFQTPTFTLQMTRKAEIRGSAPVSEKETTISGWTTSKLTIGPGNLFEKTGDQARAPFEFEFIGICRQVKRISWLPFTGFKPDLPFLGPTTIIPEANFAGTLLRIKVKKIGDITK